MPLYLVRWPGPRASLISAAGEEELMEIIDEVDTPGQCTWSVYRDELWIDFALPIKAKIEERHPGPLRADEVTVTDVSEFLHGELRPSVPESDTGSMMEEAILRGAFPKTAAVFDEVGEERDGPNSDRLREAIAADLVAHDQATALDGARIAPDLTLRRTTTWIFRRLQDGSFADVPAANFIAFLCGDDRLEPEPDGYVRACQVEVMLEEQRAVEARIDSWAQFPTEKEGTIRAAYNAREFMRSSAPPAPVAPEGMLDAAARFLEQRKKALEWEPEDDDLLEAATAVNEKAGEPILIDDFDD
jgi:hypothetical protein